MGAVCLDWELAVTNHLSYRDVRLRRRPRARWDLWLLAAATPWLGTGAQAQIRTDGSLGPAAQTLTGPNYSIPQTLGKLAGNNLFHSFQTFNLASGEAANFSTTSPTLANVISRVTGGELSQINGTLRLTAAGGATPAFFFINPAGVTFGAGASVDVPGAFHVSTANYLKFPDGRVYADTTSGSTFSSADPTAFGFLGSTRATIKLKDAALATTTGALTLVAGDVGIDHAAVSSNSGELRIVANGPGAAEVNRVGVLPTASGRLDLRNGGYFYTEATAQDAGGNIRIAAGDTGIHSGALVVTATTTDRPAGSITAELTSLEIDGRSAAGNTGITSQAAISDIGAGGDVTVSALGGVRILGGGLITSDTYGAGTAGDVTIKAGSVLLDGAGHVNSARITNRASGGRAGLLSVEAADSIDLIHGSQVSSDSFGAGKAGTINLRAGNEIRVLTDSFIASDAYAAGNAGSISITVPSLTIDGVGGTLLTQVSSQALENSQGNAGSIHITTPIGLRLSHGGKIVTSTYKSGNGGDIQVDAGAVLIDGRDSDRFTGIFSTAEYSSSGNAGSIRVTTPGELQLIDGGKIETSTYSLGNGGNIQVAAGSLRLDGGDSDRTTGVFSAAEFFSSGNAGSIRITTPASAQLINGARVETNTRGSGKAGDIQFDAGTLLLEGLSGLRPTGIFSIADVFSSGHAGKVTVNVSGDAQILQSSEVSSNTWSLGNAGGVVFRANNLLIDGKGNFASASINSEAAGGSSGNGGSVTVDVPGHLQIFDVGFISSGTSGSGNAGSVNVSAGRLTIDGKASLGLAGIDSGTFLKSPGAGGSVTVTVAGDASITNGYIQSRSNTPGTSGRGGDITLVVGGNLKVGGGGRIHSDTSGSGNAGKIDISANEIVLARGAVDDYAWIFSDSRGSGAAGSVRVQASKSIELAEGGFITSDAYGTGHGGTVTVNAPQIRIGGPGMVKGAAISSDATRYLDDPNKPSGDAGAVTVVAQSLTIEGGLTEFPTGITSRTYSGTTGNAGSITVKVRGELQITSGGVITSSTNDSGRGGEVLVNAGAIAIGTGSQIGARASGFSSGQPGNVTVQSDGALVLRSGGTLSIENDGNSTHPSTVSTSTLAVQAVDLMIDGGAIKANSTGNVAAGTIQINASDRLTLTQGSITTSANSGNGGSINVSGGKLVTLNNSQITTSVTGATGNGGDIQISADALILNSGFIQANTAASNASGGLVNIDVKTLIASGSTLFVGGQSAYDFAPGVFSFNVIQAAAPTGVSGAIDITSPVLDLSGSLGRLNAQVMDNLSLGRSPCEVTAGSSLAVAGRGGLPVTHRGLLRAEAVSAAPPKRSGAPLSNQTPTALTRLAQASCL